MAKPTTSLSRGRRRIAALASLSTVLASSGTFVALTAAPAFADIVPVPGNASGALSIAQAMATDSVTVSGATWNTFPPGGADTNAVSDTPLTAFPTAGTSYGILTTGDARLADDPNDSPSSGANVGGGGSRGDSAYDISVLAINLTVPSSANCLSLDFRFLSEEYPEYVGSQFNDAFIAELDSDTWTTSGSNIEAPDNFAFDPAGNPISINAAGVTSMTAADAGGTTYDGATPQLNASQAAAPGNHTLYLSIFDQGDHAYDSAVFLDNLRSFFDPNCGGGAEQTDEDVSKNVAAGGSITTDDTGDGATDSDPIETTVTSPNAGLVSIHEGTNSGDYTPPAGYYFLDVQSTVHAPDATDADHPIHIRFLIDSTELPTGFSPDHLLLVKDGTAIPRCVDPGAAVADPDPCWTSSTAGDDLAVDVYTTTLSTFNFAYPETTAGPTCQGLPVTIVGGTSPINGTAGPDVILGTPGNDVINAGGGNDVVCAGKGNDTVNGEAGNDLLLGQAGNDTVRAGDGNDRAYGNDGNDAVFGGPGDDVVKGGRGDDRVQGQAGADRVYGGAGDDRVFGNDGNDQVYGDVGSDKVYGGQQVDTCDGGADGDSDAAQACETTVNFP